MSVTLVNVRLDEFVQKEIKRILIFASKWREANKDKGDVFPLTGESEVWWYGQYMAFLRSKEQPKKKEVETTVTVETTTETSEVNAA